MAKPHRISSAAQLEQALAELEAADARLAAVLRSIAKPKFVARRRHGFEALVEIVVSQQLSGAAADTIFGRLKQKVSPLARRRSSQPTRPPCAPAVFPRPSNGTSKPSRRRFLTARSILIASAGWPMPMRAPI